MYENCMQELTEIIYMEVRLLVLWIDWLAIKKYGHAPKCGHGNEMGLFIIYVCIGSRIHTLYKSHLKTSNNLVEHYQKKRRRRKEEENKQKRRRVVRAKQRLPGPSTRRSIIASRFRRGQETNKIGLACCQARSIRVH